MYSYEYPHPAVTVDIAVFTQERKPLKLLLIQRANEPHRGEWALPGGFVDIDEDLETAARRELEEETGITVGDIDQPPHLWRTRTRPAIACDHRCLHCVNPS